jgi:hypothetical protein
MNNKTTNPYGIKTPKDVREFRENLKKYYMVHPINTEVLNYGVNVEDLDINNLYLYVNTDTDDYDIPLMDISNLDDLYEICEGEPMITPKMDMDNLFFNEEHSNENNFKIYETQEEFLTEGEPRWYSLSSQLVREFYMMTLGDYSGYKYVKEMN